MTVKLLNTYWYDDLHLCTLKSVQTKEIFTANVAYLFDIEKSIEIISDLRRGDFSYFEGFEGFGVQKECGLFFKDRVLQRHMELKGYVLEKENIARMKKYLNNGGIL